MNFNSENICNRFNLFFHSNYLADKEYCGNSLLSRKANRGRLICLIDISSVVLKGCYSIMKLAMRCMTLAIITFHSILIYSSSIIIEKKLRNSKYFPNIKISFTLEEMEEKKRQTKKNIKELFLRSIIFSRKANLILGYTFIGSFTNIVGLALPEIGRWARQNLRKTKESKENIAQSKIEKAREILNITENASSKQIYDSYKQLSKIHHPDKKEIRPNLKKFWKLKLH